MASGESGREEAANRFSWLRLGSEKDDAVEEGDMVASGEKPMTVEGGGEKTARAGFAPVMGTANPVATLTPPAVVTVDLRIVAPGSVRNGVTPDAHKYGEGARYASLKGIMAAKKKAIDVRTLADLGVTDGAVVTYTKFERPPARTGSVRFVESAQELVQRLKTEAKVL